ncbi:unnamed protein product [Cuscuta epithymum]|uniref:Dof zinc finger protein n=1 Tax=Cuscuta epithymum TaxID=186058 RepID=A0AAV0FXX9_9ASTE|nr:unnamed protein product [Cuscuta epithymum]CAH9140189.1 unnamed protein product [Cuscuta epithymum]
MQDIHLIGGGGGRFFGGGDRRLRPNQHHSLPALKCPRCDSLNTKFCYFNNYNLSQPRHFCKSCRRYWTKGGVLRNVPVGGGCRKNKRSRTKSSVSTPDCKSSSHSSSESSGLTGTTTTAVTDVNSGAASVSAEVASTSAKKPSPSSFGNRQDSGFLIPQIYDQPATAHAGDDQIFQEIGNFTNMIGGFDDIPPAFQYPDAKWLPQQVKMVGQALKMPDIMAAEFLDQTDQIDFTSLQQSRGSEVGLPPLDWHAGAGVGDHELFDLPGAVDQVYWSQTHWG